MAVAGRPRKGCGRTSSARGRGARPGRGSGRRGGVGSRGRGPGGRCRRPTRSHEGCLGPSRRERRAVQRSSRVGRRRCGVCRTGGLRERRRLRRRAVGGRGSGLGSHRSRRAGSRHARARPGGSSTASGGRSRSHRRFSPIERTPSRRRGVGAAATARGGSPWPSGPGPPSGTPRLARGRATAGAPCSGWGLYLGHRPLNQTRPRSAQRMPARGRLAGLDGGSAAHRAPPGRRGGPGCVG